MNLSLPLEKTIDKAFGKKAKTNAAIDNAKEMTMKMILFLLSIQLL